MKRIKNISLGIILFVLATTGYAQKGVGNQSGIGQSNTPAKPKQISGEIKEVLKEPCTQTTGRYDQGTHLLVESEVDSKDHILNIHLGPTAVLNEMTNQLKPGRKIQLKVFKTSDLPKNQYIAKSYVFNQNSYTLRDADLRPFWANNRGKKRRTW
jgi:hypothetical protein